MSSYKIVAEILFCFNNKKPVRIPAMSWQQFEEVMNLIKDVK